MTRVVRGATLGLTAVAVPFLVVAGLAGSVVAGVLAIVAAILLVRVLSLAPGTWPEIHRPRAVAVTTTALAVVLLSAALFGNYAVAIDHDLCGEGSGSWIAIIIATLAYIVLATAVLARSRRGLWLWPFAIVPAWALHLVLLFVLPGTSGFCET